MGIRVQRPGRLASANRQKALRILPPDDVHWETRLRELREFKQRHGHCNVPRGWPENPSLSYWVINQRRKLRLRTLPPERLEWLHALGVSWRTTEDRTRERELHWNRLCDALHEFLRVHGHCDVPEKWKDNPELARWVIRQRHLKRTGALREDRLDRFEKRGIDWLSEPRRSRIRDRAWDRMYVALREFRKAHGDCSIPKGWSGNPRLGRWVSRQRFMIRHNLLRPDRRSRLEDLGILTAAARTPVRSRETVPGARERVWRESYEALARFHAETGHSNVPRRLSENPSLARWVSHQRTLRSSGRLSKERILLLDGLRFPWSGRDALERDRKSTWDLKFSRLAAYRREHGHCDVPVRWEQDPSLGRWVAAQRVLHRRGQLKPDRRQLLDAEGFNWQA